MKLLWNLPETLQEATTTQIFSGGACNILDGRGRLLRNEERDPINNWLTERGYRFFDPQVHPDTHGMEYDYHIHHPMEVAARDSAKINLYEVSPRTFGGVTSFEIAADHFQFGEPTIIYFSDGDSQQDNIPVHSPEGHPLFTPDGIDNNKDATQAHLKEFTKNANNMRKYLMGFAREMDTLSVGFSDNPANGDIVITPDKMHGSELFEAVVRAASNQRTFVTFTGGESAQDDRGNPIIILPSRLREQNIQAILDQYVDEGNALRRAIAKLVDISVYTRVVYTQKAVIMALEEVLHLTDTKPAQAR